MKKSYYLLKLYEEGVSPHEIATLMNRTVGDINHSIKVIKKKSEFLKEKGFTPAKFAELIREQNGDTYKISSVMKIETREVTILAGHFTITYDLLGKVYEPKKPKFSEMKSFVKNGPKVRMNPNELYLEKNPIRQALAKLGNKVRYDKKNGFIFEGRPVSVRILLEEAGIDI